MILNPQVGIYDKNHPEVPQGSQELVYAGFGTEQKYLEAAGGLQAMVSFYC